MSNFMVYKSIFERCDAMLYHQRDMLECFLMVDNQCSSHIEANIMSLHACLQRYESRMKYIWGPTFDIHGSEDNIRKYIMGKFCPGYLQDINIQNIHRINIQNIIDLCNILEYTRNMVFKRYSELQKRYSELKDEFKTTLIQSIKNYLEQLKNLIHEDEFNLIIDELMEDVTNLDNKNISLKEYQIRCNDTLNKINIDKNRLTQMPNNILEQISEIFRYVFNILDRIVTGVLRANESMAETYTPGAKIFTGRNHFFNQPESELGKTLRKLNEAIDQIYPLTLPQSW